MTKYFIPPEGPLLKITTSPIDLAYLVFLVFLVYLVSLVFLVYT